MGLINNLFNLGGSNSAPSAASQQYLELCNSILGDRLTPGSGTAKRLLPAIEAANEYFTNQVAAIPGPIALSSDAYARDPLIAALLPSVDEIRIALGRSMEVRENLPALAADGQPFVHALLGMRCRADHQTPGEPPVFADHTLKCLAAKESGAREAVKRVGFTRLLKHYVEHLDRLRNKGKLLRIEWNIANDEAAPSTGSGEYIYASDELTPEKMLYGLCAWLNDPGRHLRVREGEITVSARAMEGRGTVKLSLPVLHTIDRRHWIVCIARFPTDEGIAALKRETRTHRYILI